MLPSRLCPPVSLMAHFGSDRLGGHMWFWRGLRGPPGGVGVGSLRRRAAAPPGPAAEGLPAGSRARRGRGRREGERWSDSRGRKMGREIRVDARGARVRERVVAATGGGRASASRDAARAPPRAPAREARPLIQPCPPIPICAPHPVFQSGSLPHSGSPLAICVPPPEFFLSSGSSIYFLHVPVYLPTVFFPLRLLSICVAHVLNSAPAA